MENSSFTYNTSASRISLSGSRSSRFESSSSEPIVIVIDEEQDSNRNFSANIFVVPLGEPTTSSSGRLSLNDVGSLILEVDDSDPEYECKCTIECWVLDTNESNNPKTKVTLCPRCEERAKRQQTTTLTINSQTASSARRNFLCPRVKTKRYLKRKQKCLKIKRVKKYKCLKCQKILPSVERLKKHNAEHKQQKHFSCPNCSKIFKVRHSAAVHILRDHKTSSM